MREPCIECEERPGFGGINTDDGSEYPCEWCGGSGTTWPDANDTTPFYDGYGTHGEVYTWGEVLDYVTDALAEGEQT